MRLPGLDLLRAIAIAWVMLFHSFVVGGLGPQWSWLSRYGWMGVDLFFVLSGFLIGAQVLRPLAAGGRLAWREFYLKRAFRILPAYWMVLALYLWWPAFREAPGLEPAWKFLTFTLNLSIDYSSNGAFSHAWSLCVEEHFYLVLPLLTTLLAGHMTARRLVWLCAAIVVGGIALRSGAWWHNHAIDPQMQQRNWFVEDIYYPTWNRLDGLLCGVLLAAFKIWRPRAWETAQRHADLVLVAGLAVMALAMWLFADRTGLAGNAVGWPVLSLGLALLVFAGAGTRSCIARRRWPLAGWLAAISYSLYLVHKGVYHLVQSQWGHALQGSGVLAFVVYGGTAIAAGALLHYSVERPFLRLRERLPSLRRQPPAQVTS